MGKYDLNNPLDFARATNSFGAGLLQVFTARGNTNWLIEEGTYISGLDPSKSVIFHVFTSARDYNGALSVVNDEGGRRKAKFIFPFMDGQLTSDMGREAENFTLEIVLHGNNYLQAFNDLMTLLQEPTPGTLIHPIRGRITCGMEHYEITHQESQRKAVAIKLKMTEHSTSALALAKAPKKTAPDRLSGLTNAFKKIEDAINAVQGAVFLVQSVKNQINQGLEELQNAYSKVTGNMNATFNQGGNIPALLPVQNGGLQGADGQIITNSTTIAVSPNDPLSGTPLELIDPNLQQALAIDAIQKSIASTRQLAANSINDLSDSGGGQGSLEFFDNIIDLRTLVNDLLLAFEAGKQSSQVKIINYIVPRIMSVREIAFANGLSPDDGDQILLLNPELESINYIPKDSTVRVAVT